MKARVVPFVGTRYNPAAIESLDKVTAPPYDVITPEMQDDLYEKSKFNIVRIILGKEQIDDDEYNNKYQRAASNLKDWRTSGVLMDDSGRHFYIYQQEYVAADGSTIIRSGFFAAIRLEAPGKGSIHAHEHTFEGPKADRLKLLRTTQCNLSPIFCLYSDPKKATDAILENTMNAAKPRMELTDNDGVIHRLWVMESNEEMKALSALLQESPFFIADGHHRYETAVNYFREMKTPGALKPGEKRPYTHTLSFLTNCEAEGLQILPTHRVLSRDLGEGVDQEEILEDLAEFFHVIPVKVDVNKAETEGMRLITELQKLGAKGSAYCMILPGGKGYFISLKDEADLKDELPEDMHEDVASLDVSILHDYIISKIWVGNPEIELDDEDVFYVKDSTAALQMLAAPTYASAVFLTNAPTMEQVRTIATQNLRMPHKSTYFYPKLITGMVLRDHSAQG